MNLLPLRHFPSFSTRDPELACAYLENHFEGDFAVTGDEPNRGFTINRAILRDVTLVYTIASFGFRARFGGENCVQQRNCLAGNGRVTSARGGADIDPRRWSATLTAGESGHVEFSPRYEGLRMIVDDKVIRRKLGALIGDAPPDRLDFMPEADISPGLARYRRLLSFLLSELDVEGSQSPGAVVTEITDALLVSYLYGHKHNLSHRLFKPEHAPSSAQQRLAEDYIAAHWNEPLTVEAIADATNVSVRSVFRSFKESYGCSPSQYIKRIRLQRARAMLLKPDEQPGVMSVALKCGFHSLGHFAKSYRSEFGELPSQTGQR